MARIRKSIHSIEMSDLQRKDISEKKWFICVYIRLSKEDTKNIVQKEEEKSESVKNQKSILTTWIKEYFMPGTYEIVDFFEDDGLTGTDDEREGFVRMLKALEEGKGNCVLVKTLSRAFRNYADQGYYLEEYFPANNVRFISIMDSFIDTYMDSEAVYSLDIPIYGVLNDRFAATTSRTVRKTLDDKRSKGKFIGAFPPWGFLKDPKDRNHLVLDPDIVPIKIKMKDWLIQEGMSLSGVAKRLNDLGIPNPTKYKRLKGWKYQNPHALENDGLWSGDTVKRVILNPVNIGYMVQGKQKIRSYKLHDKIQVPEEEWYIVKNMLDPTFTLEEYRTLETMLGRDTRTANGKRELHLFAGFIRCADCQKAMHRSHCGKYIYYKCRTREEKSKKACNVHSIREDKLRNAVFHAIQIQIAILDSFTEIKEKLENESCTKKNADTLERQKEEKKQNIQKIRDLYDEVYTDWKIGRLSEEECLRMRRRYKTEMEKLEDAVKHIESERQRVIKKEFEKSDYMKEFFQYKNIQNLDRAMLLSFIDVIYIHENKEITIKFSFQDELLRRAKEKEKSG